MIIDLLPINDGRTSSIKIDDKVVIPEEYLTKSEILELKNLNLVATLKYIEGEFSLIGELKGTMVIEDSISLDPINYDFLCQIDEEIEDFIENSQKSLDITEILWQNIVLEVPLKLTNVSNFDEYHGDGWKLISEDSKELTNNPFKELEDMLRKE